jgi:hypothetical protein
MLVFWAGWVIISSFDQMQFCQYVFRVQIEEVQIFVLGFEINNFPLPVNWERSKPLKTQSPTQR